MFSGFKISVKQWKKHFFKLSFLKCAKQVTLFFIFNPWSIFHIFIHWFLEITFLCQWLFFISWQTNKVILSASQKLSLLSTTLYVTLYCTILFHLLLYKNENECMKMAEIKEKGSCHNLDTLETMIRMLLDVTNILMVSLNWTFSEFKPIKRKI